MINVTGKTIGAAGFVLLAAGPALAAAQRPTEAPLATPKGVLLEALGRAQGYSLDKTTAAVVPRDHIVFATAQGLTLYTSDADPAGKSVCVDDCTKTWRPMPVAAGATPVPDWTVITRPDGTKQWAYKGKALYSYIADKDPGSVAGSSPARFARGPGTGPRGAASASIPKDNPVPTGWQVAYFYPMTASNFPSGFGIKEVDDALGIVLVDNHDHTLYTAQDAARAKACKADTCNWVAVVAPQIAEPLGDFAPVWRDDGVRQWSYKGQGLYTFAGDLSVGEANGIGADKGWQAARIVRYFAPVNVTLHDTPKLGKVFADANGMTLYMRDAFIFQSGSGHSLRHGSPIRPAVGRDLGTDPRCGDCTKEWHPFLAPADAQGSGNWEVYARADGSKQWVYEGYALWSYDGDRKPGDINGNDSYQLEISNDPNKAVDIGTIYDGATALYWIAAHP